MTYLLNRAVRSLHCVAGPSALIGASNFFELAVATAIALFGFNSGAALATVVGVLIEVPVMLLVVDLVIRTQGRYETRPGIPTYARGPGSVRKDGGQWRDHGAGPRRIMGEEIRGHCWNCGQGLTKLEYGRELRCPRCDKPTHCCRNCRHYAPGRPNECREPMVDRVIAKDRANFCDWFQPLLRSHSPQAGETQSTATDPESLKRAAEDLFK